jgi:hypothetical protein
MEYVQGPGPIEVDKYDRPIFAIQMVAPASPVFRPSSPDVAQNMLIGVVLALACGITGGGILLHTVFAGKGMPMIDKSLPPTLPGERFDY